MLIAEDESNKFPKFHAVFEKLVPLQIEVLWSTW